MRITRVNALFMATCSGAGDCLDSLPIAAAMAARSAGTLQPALATSDRARPASSANSTLAK